MKPAELSSEGERMIKILQLPLCPEAALSFSPEEAGRRGDGRRWKMFNDIKLNRSMWIEERNGLNSSNLGVILHIRQNSPTEFIVVYKTTLWKNADPLQTVIIQYPPSMQHQLQGLRQNPFIADAKEVVDEERWNFWDAVKRNLLG